MQVAGAEKCTLVASATRMGCLAGKEQVEKVASKGDMRRSRQCVRGRLWVAGVAMAGLLCGCSGGKDFRGYTVQAAGSAQRGRLLIAKYKCGSCHMIPGIHGADGQFGPPLLSMSRRTYIAGEFENTPQNLAHWIQDPQGMKPKTTMPELGLNQQEATDIAAYLQTLR